MDLTNEQIDAFISLGYDLHIHDQSGTYPGGLDRDEWEKTQKEGILQRHLTTKSSRPDYVQACSCKPGMPKEYYKDCSIHGPQSSG